MVRGLTPTPNESSVPPWEMLAECVLAAHHTTYAKTRHVSHVVEMAPCPQWHDHERQEQLFQPNRKRIEKERPGFHQPAMNIAGEGRITHLTLLAPASSLKTMTVLNTDAQASAFVNSWFAASPILEEQQPPAVMHNHPSWTNLCCAMTQSAQAAAAPLLEE